MSKPLLILGILGLIVFLFFSKKRELKLIAIPMLSVIFLWLLADFANPIYSATPYNTIFNAQRLSADIRAGLFIFAALLLAEIAHIKFKLEKEKKVDVLLYVVLLIVILISFSAFKNTQNFSKSIMTTSIQDVNYLRQLYANIPPGEGRIMQEQLLYRLGANPLSFTHAESLGPILSGREFIVYNTVKISEHFEIDYLDGYLTNKLKEYKTLYDFFNRANIKYVIASNPDTKKILNASNTTALFDYGPWTVYDTGITPSYFEIGSGKIIGKSYSGTIAEATVLADSDTTLLFKVHSYPNWDVRIDGKKATQVNKNGYMMEVKVPAGQHTLEFRYRMVALDYFSYLLSVIGIVLLVLIYRWIDG